MKDFFSRIMSWFEPEYGLTWPFFKNISFRLPWVRYKENIGVKIEFSDNETRSQMEAWGKREEVNIEDFSKFLKIIGFNQAVLLSNFSETERMFDCADISGKNAKIKVSELHICVIREIEANVIEEGYYSECNSKVLLYKRTVKAGGRIITSYYKVDSCERTITFEDGLVLKVEFAKQKESKTEMPLFFALKNNEEIESYLLNLVHPVSAEKVCEEVSAKHGNVAFADKVQVLYTKNEQLLAKIVKVGDKTQEYAALNGGNTVHVYENGSWKYEDYHGNEVEYLKGKEEGKAKFNIHVDERIVSIGLLENLMETAEKEISEMWKYL